MDLRFVPWRTSAGVLAALAALAATLLVTYLSTLLWEDRWPAYLTVAGSVSLFSWLSARVEREALKQRAWYRLELPKSPEVADDEIQKPPVPSTTQPPWIHELAGQSTRSRHRR